MPIIFIDLMLNEKECGYCARNGREAVDMKTWGSFKMNVIYFEVKTVDWIGVANKTKSKKENLCKTTKVFYLFSIEGQEFLPRK